MKLRELLQKMIEIQTKIGASEPYICGGTPRDKYLKQLDKIADLDITTGDKTIDYLSQEFSIFLRKNYNVTRKVMPDGHSTIYVGNLKMDFSSNFVLPDIKSMLYKIGINNPTEMQLEIFSRDFTCNALLLSLDLKNLTDPTNKGFDDINKRKIVTCLSPDITLTSNRNRVIRVIYLASKLGFDVDESIINFVKQHPETVKISTPKSLSEKMEEAFKWDADKASYLLTKMNLWDYVPISDTVSPYYIKHTKGTTNG